MNLIELALKENVPELTLSVISLLKQLKNQGLPILLRLSRDSDLLRAKAALSVLGEIKDPLITSYLGELINDKSIDQFIKEAAIEALIS